jgi:hypothetical protein
MPQDFDRRDFLVSITGGTVALASKGRPGLSLVMESLADGKYRSLSAAQAKLLGAITEQIVPTDEFPGATASGVVAYIDGILAGPYGKFYKDDYENGLKSIDAFATNNFQRDFVSLEPAQQAAVLSQVESGKADGDSGKRFFNLLLGHTFEGYYAKAHHGAEGANPAWKMIGFEG